jgi:hypothetical protein
VVYDTRGAGTAVEFVGREDESVDASKYREGMESGGKSKGRI